MVAGQLKGKSEAKTKGTTYAPARTQPFWMPEPRSESASSAARLEASVLDGYSRYIVDWEIRESMKEVDIEILLQRALEKFPERKVLNKVVHGEETTR